MNASQPASMTTGSTVAVALVALDLGTRASVAVAALAFSILFIYYSRNTGHSFWVYWAPFILAGAMSPVTVAGTATQTLAEARRRHPTRFATTTDPKILDLPQAAWINKPPKPEETAA